MMRHHLKRVVVTEPDLKTTLDLMAEVGPDFELRFEVLIDDQALCLAVDVAFKHCPDSNPSAAYNIIQAACVIASGRAVHAAQNELDTIDDQLTGRKATLAWINGRPAGLEGKRKRETENEIIALEAKRNKLDGSAERRELQLLRELIAADTDTATDEQLIRYNHILPETPVVGIHDVYRAWSEIGAWDEGGLTKCKPPPVNSVDRCHRR